MENAAVEQLTKWAGRQAEQSEHEEYIARGRHSAYQEMVNHINQSCMECGEYFYSLDRLAEHQVDKHPEPLPELPAIEVPSYGSSG